MSPKVYHNRRAYAVPLVVKLLQAFLNILGDPNEYVPSGV